MAKNKGIMGSLLLFWEFALHLEIVGAMAREHKDKLSKPCSEEVFKTQLEVYLPLLFPGGIRVS